MHYSCTLMLCCVCIHEMCVCASILIVCVCACVCKSVCVCVCVCRKYLCVWQLIFVTEFAKRDHFGAM